MQIVTSTYNTNSKKDLRKILSKVQIDWEQVGVYFDETGYALSIEVERKISEPLGGVHMGQCDLVLANETDRYTFPATNPA